MKVTLFQGKEGEGLLVPWPGRTSVVRYFGPLCKGITGSYMTRHKRQQ